MTALKKRDDKFIMTFSGLVALLSMATFMAAIFILKPFQDMAFIENVSLPALTQVIISTHHWVWLGAVLSLIGGFLNHQRVLSQLWTVRILSGIATCTISYIITLFIALYMLLSALIAETAMI